jgi:hypothetical protein
VTTPRPPSTDAATDAALDALGTTATSPPALGAALEAELAHLTAVAPRRPGRQLAAITAGSLLYASAIVAALSVRADAAELPRAWLVAVAAGWLLGFVVPCALALRPAPGAVLPRSRAAATAGGLAAITFLTLGLVVHPSGPSSLAYGWEAFGRGHSCLELGLLTAALPAILAAAVLRGALPVGARWTGAAIGAGSGCLGGLMLHLHCRVADGLHVGLVHGGVVVVAAALAAALVPRATAT